MEVNYQLVDDKLNSSFAANACRGATGSTNSQLGVKRTTLIEVSFY